MDITPLTAIGAMFVAWIGSIEARIKGTATKDDVEMMVAPQKVLLNEIKEDVQRIEAKLDRLGEQRYGRRNKNSS